jgi:hypothetical protein
VRTRKLWQQEGFSDVFHYARVVAGLSTKTARDLLRVADGLRHLPHLTEGYVSGAIPFSKVREIVRIASVRSEEAWAKEAPHLSCRVIEDLVARARWGDTPEEARSRRAGEGVGPETVPFVLHLRPEVHALLSEAIDACRRMANGKSIDEAVSAFAEVILQNDEAQRVSQRGCRAVVEPETDGNGKANLVLDGAHKPPFQVVVYRCEACGGGKVGPAGLPAPPDLLERTECDADVVDLTGTGRSSSKIPPRVRRAVMLRDRGRCQVPECGRRLWTECHHVVWRSKGGGHEADNILVVCPLCRSRHKLHHAYPVNSEAHNIS